MFPADGVKAKIQPGLPHVSGGVSTYEEEIIDTFESSPREWGCFQIFLSLKLL